MSKSWGDGAEIFDFKRESVDNAAPPVEACPCCGEALDTRWPVIVPEIDAKKLWARCGNCGAWVEQL